MSNAQFLDKVEKLKDAMLSSPSSGRAELVRVFVGQLKEQRDNQLLFSKVELWNCVYELLHEGIEVEELWAFVRETSLRADPSQQAALSASIFVLIAEAPWDSPLKHRLFALLEERRLWWVFELAYFPTPSKFYEDFAAIVANG